MRHYHLAEAKQKAVVGLILLSYMEGGLTKMQAAEALKLDREGIDKLLLKYNLPTIMNFTEEDMKITAKNRENYAKRLGVKT